MRVLLTLTFVYLTHAAQGQSMGYKTFNEYLSNTPSVTIKLPLNQRTDGDVFMKGGITNHRFRKVKPKTLKIELEQNIWGVEYEGKTYINAFPYSKLKGFNEILGKGFYSYFIGEPARTLEEQRTLGIVGPNEKIKAVCCKVGYVLFSDGSIKILSPELLQQLIKDNSQLSQELQTANLKLENVPEMFKFLDKYNDAKN